MPRDLVGPPVVLTGKVTADAADCPVLTAHGRRWALLGPAATTLRIGRSATVRGRPAAVPTGCDADAALTVSRVD